MTTSAGPPHPRGPAVVQVLTLGRFRVVANDRAVEEDGWRRRKPRQLLKYLCAHPGHRASKEELTELLWPESDPDAASTNLRTTVYALRQALQGLGDGMPDQVLLADREAVALSRANVWIDADEFERLMREAEHVADPLALLQAADALYVGEFLRDDVYEEWANRRRDYLKDVWTELQYKLAGLADYAGQVHAMDRLLQADPCSERAATELMNALLAQGRRLDALRVYQRVQQALHDELDVEPGEALVKLRDQAQTAALPPPTEVRARSFQCSYPLPTPDQLIGRDGALQQLSRVLIQGRQSGAMVIVSGPAGMGKSALVSALISQARAGGVLCLAGGCYEQRGMVPLGPFHDALADYLLAESPEQARAELGASAQDLSTLIPELRHHLHIEGIEPLDPDRERMRQFGAVVSYLRSLCQRQPVLLCLEDLHAADAASIHLIHYVARQMRRSPITLVATLRSDGVQLPDPLGPVVAAIVQERLASRLVLGPLDPGATHTLVSMLLDAPPSMPLAQWIHRTAEGNPLFVEQLVFALKESGQLESASGEWRSVVDPERMPPHVIRDVIRGRLDNLGPSAREVLSTAAVLGQAFDYQTLLAALDPDNEVGLLGSLEEGLDTHILQETPTGFAFAHTLLHQAMYWSISTPRRMRLHARAGETIERLAGEHRNDLCAELAHHFAHAGLARVTRDKAISYGLEAGRRAAAVSAFGDAHQAYAQLSSLVESDSDVDAVTRAAILEGRARSELQLAMWNQSIDTFTLLIRLTNDPLTKARSMASIAYALHHTDRAAEAPGYIDQALLEVEGVAPGAELAALRLQLLLEKALHLFLEGKYYAQAALAEEMLRQAVGMNEPTPIGVANTAAGIARMGLGDFDRASEHFELARRSAELAQDKVRSAIAEDNLGLLHLRMGNLDRSREHFETALRLYTDTSTAGVGSGPGSRAVNALQGLARVSVGQGRLEEAQAQAETAWSLARNANDRWAAECQFVRGLIYAHAADWEHAEACFEQSLGIRQRVGHAAGVVESLVGLGTVREARGDPAGARDLYHRATEVADHMDPSPWGVSALRHLGLVLLEHFDPPRGEQILRRAASMVESMQHSVEYAPTIRAKEQLKSVGGPR